jgi:hypothetical protein
MRTHRQIQQEMGMIPQHLRKWSEIISAVMTIAAYPLWWLTTKEFCISQPPTFLIFICAGYGILAITRPSKIVVVSGIYNLVMAMLFTLNLYYDFISVFNLKMPVLVIIISTVLCGIISIYKDLLLRRKM